MINKLVEKALRDLQKYWLTDEVPPELNLAIAEDLDQLIMHLAKYDGRIAELMRQYDWRMRIASE